ncbi:50S ribosome-binding GTPase [Patescibacteria group bacterium]|nr:50S ribosome-binding GTPase [Patescibacteria group bacterium]
MPDIQEQIQKIEEEIRKTPYHKATEHHIGKLRAKLSKLKDKQYETSIKKRGGGGLRLRGASGSERGYAVKKQGDATVVIVGPPSVGKSTLLNKLTNAKSKIAPYEFTTVTVIPGMMEYKDAKIQILDVPGLIEGAEEGKGKGREILSVARGADLIIILCDVGGEDMFNRVSASLEKSGIRLNKQPPNVAVENKVQGGILIHTNFKQSLDKETIIDVAKELGVKNAEITIKEKLSLERLVDAFSKSRVYVPTVSVLNKIDLKKGHKEGKNNSIDLTISAEKNINLDRLKNLIWQKLNFVRVYLVKHSDKPKSRQSIIMKEGDTLSDVANKVGSEFAENKKKAKIWGTGAKYAGQDASLSTEVKEGMQVRFI